MLMRLIVSLALLGSFASPGRPDSPVAEFGGTIIYGPAATAPFHLRIERLSTSAERASLISAIKRDRFAPTDGPIGIPVADLGYIAMFPPTLETVIDGSRETVRYAAERRTDDGVRHVILLSQRGTAGVTWTELVLRQDGAGEGYQEIGAALTVNGAGDDIVLKEGTRPYQVRTILRLRK